MGALLLTRELSFMQWWFVELVSNYHQMRKYNWCKAILSTTLRSLRRRNLQFGGCPMFLLYWICEHSDILPCLDERFWPRFRKWNLNELSMKINAGHVNIPAMLGFEWKYDALDVCVCGWAWVGRAPPAHVGITSEDCHHEGNIYTGVLESPFTSRAQTAKVRFTPTIEQVTDIVAGEVTLTCIHPLPIGDDSVNENDALENFEVDVLTQVDPTGESEPMATTEEIFSEDAYEDELANLQTSMSFFTLIDAMECETDKYVFNDMEWDLLDEELVLEWVFKSHNTKSNGYKFVRDLFKKDAEVEQLRGENLELRQQLNLLREEVNVLRIAAKSAEAQVGAANCKKKPIAKKRNLVVQKTGDKMLIKALTNGRRSVVSGLKMNSMVKRLRERPLRPKKHLPEYTYDTKAKKVKRSRANKLLPIPCNLDSDALVDATNTKLVPKLLSRRDVKAVNINEFHKDTIVEVERVNSEKGPRGVVWSSKITGDAVIVGFLKEIMTGGELNDIVINGRSELLQQLNPRVRVVDAGSWSYIAQMETNDYGVMWYIDHPPLCNFNDYDLMLFPINTSGQFMNTSTTCHWTLLVFDVVERKWTHYNSLLPKRRTASDGHLENAKLVKEYVEAKIMNIISKDVYHQYADVNFEKTGDIVQSFDTPQQIKDRWIAECLCVS